METTYDVPELLKFATNVARRMWDDIEAESAAGNALNRALNTYDGRTSIKGWVSYCVRVEVRDLWRRFHYTSAKMTRTIQHKADVFWLRIGAPDNEEISEFQKQFPFYWTLLVERFIEKLPLDVLARDRSTTVKIVKQNIETGVELLLKCLNS